MIDQMTMYDLKPRAAELTEESFAKAPASSEHTRKLMMENELLQSSPRIRFKVITR